MKNKYLFALLFILSTIIIFLPLIFKTKIEDFQAFGLIGVLLINFFSSATVLLPTPSILSVGIAGNIYNPLLVAISASIGSALGEAVGFLFGFSSREVLNLKKHKILYHLEKYMKKHLGAAIILLFSFVPNPVFDGLGIVVGLSSYPLKKFLILVFIGRFARNLLIAFISAKL